MDQIILDCRQTRNEFGYGLILNKCYTSTFHPPRLIGMIHTIYPKLLHNLKVDIRPFNVKLHAHNIKNIN